MARDGKVFIQFCSDALPRQSSGWVHVAKMNEAGKKVMVEGQLLHPDIVFCKVARYLVDGRDGSEYMDVTFNGEIYKIPLRAIKNVVIRPENS